VPEFGGVGTSASSSGSSRAARPWTFIRTKVPRGKGENPNRKELWVTSDEVVESHGDCFGARGELHADPAVGESVDVDD
jgi:hypothetical protein